MNQPKKKKALRRSSGQACRRRSAKACRRDSARTPLFMVVRTDGGPLWAFDLGMGGLKCYTRQFVDVGTYLSLTFALPGEGEMRKVGAQVTQFNRFPGGGLSLHLRFCRPGTKLLRDLYRFLDGRRGMWEHATDRRGPAPDTQNPGSLAGVASRSCDLVEPKSFAAAQDRPFAPLLRDAFDTLRANEVDRPDFARLGASPELFTLSRILAENDGAEAA